MPGYMLIEMRNMQPHKPKGIAPAVNVIGILDFLRELQEDPLSLPRLSKWHMVGLEEVLFAARPRDMEIAAEIHSRLDSAANDLERRLLEVQVVFSGEIVRGADMVVKYRGASLPIHRIFNHPPREEDSHGNPLFPMEFHLSSP
ncbi:MAG: hypothetical protein ACLQNE_00405 [Thermoguttaceae bacterium]